jgi:hypothetical protein
VGDMFGVGSAVVLIRLPAGGAGTVGTMEEWYSGARLEIVCPGLDGYCI